jgi:type VI secretion system protein ImpA
MSAGLDAEGLLQPIAADQPCGQSLEDTAQLSSIDAARVFGRSRPLDAPPDQQDIWKPPDWSELRRTTIEALAVSRDLRVLASLGVALLRTDGIAPFLQVLAVASGWLERYWAETYPRIDDDGDAMLRRNALNCLADGMAVIDALRRLPLVTSRQHGTFSLRDVDLATGQIPPRDGETPPDGARIDAAFAAMPIEELTALQQGAAGGHAALRRIEVAMGTQAGPDAVPAFDPLTTVLTRLDRVLRAHLAARTGADEAGMDEAPSADGAGAAAAVGAIRSRQDAVRALDAVAEYFRRNEPSSPIPIFVDRAKRLVSKTFIEVLADVVPDALPQVRMVGGIPEGD